jgi:ATP-dependent helicase/nuclease subunit B
MPSLKIYTGPFQSYYFFSSQIIESVHNKQNDYLVILPVNRAVRLFKRKLINVSAEKVLFNTPVFTFDNLLLQLYKTMPGAKRIVSSEMLYLIVENILDQRIGDLKFFSSGGTAVDSLVKRTTEIITELRRFGYDSHEFEKLQLAEKNNIPLKYDNFKILLSTLDERFGNILIDEPLAIHTAAKLLRENQFQSYFPDVKNIYISGYGLFTPAMYLLIEKFSTWCNVYLKLEYNLDNPDLFAHTQAAYERFYVMGAQIIKHKNNKDLSKQLFNRQEHPEIKCDQKNRIIIQGLKHREEEIEFIAWKIREMNLKENIFLHKIALTFSNLEKYVPLIRQKFKDYQIPFNLSTGFNLNQSPLIRTFLNCIALIDGGFEYNEVLRFFNNAFIKTPEEWNPHLLRKIFTENRIRFLSKKQLEQLAGQLEKSNHPGEDAYFIKLQQIKLLTALLKLFYDFPLKADIATIRSSFIKLLNEQNLLSWYRDENNLLSEKEKESEFRAFNRFMKLLDKLIWTLNYLHGSEEITLKYFNRCLQNTVNQAIYNLKELPDYGVQIMPRLEILALDFDVLFVGGLVDGDFPRVSTKDVFFSDTVREEMNLLASEELLDQDRFIFYSLLDSSAEKLFLTYPKYQDDRALTPSTFLMDLHDAAEVADSANVDENAFLNMKKLELDLGLNIQKMQSDKATNVARDLFLQMPVEEVLWLFNKIRNTRQRITPGRFSLIEGNLSPVGAIREILKREYARRTWSVTQLEEYAFCPMQFFLDRILKIEDEPEFEEDINNLERGLIIHDILFKFFTGLQKLNMCKYPAAHRDLLFSIAEFVFNQKPFRGFFWKLERDIYFGTSESTGLLKTFLEYDQQKINETGYIPDQFELAFGYTYGAPSDQSSSSKSVTLKNANGQIKIMGKIDRIDKDQNSNVLIFDYKTGVQASSVKAQEILTGLMFQLPLYLLAYNLLNPGFRAVYGGYYLVKDAENCSRNDVIADKSRVQFISERSQAALPHKKVIDEEGKMLSLNELLDHSLNIAIRKTNELQQGIFRHTRFPDEVICQQYCEFRRMCQKNVGKLRSG